MALFTCTAKLNPGANGARCAWAMAIHRAVGISRQRNSGYRPSRVNIMAQGLSTPDPSLSPTQLSIRRGHATTTHYTQHYTSPLTGVAHWASLWGRPRCWHAKGACATPKEKERKKEQIPYETSYSIDLRPRNLITKSWRQRSHVATRKTVQFWWYKI